jgi:hypothetical protein
LRPVKIALAALMTMTLSPSSTCGVYEALCFPRRRNATIEASRPTTSPVASIVTHFFSISAGLAEYVFMMLSLRTWRPERLKRQLSSRLRLDWSTPRFE